MPSFCSSNCCRCNVAGGTPHITFFTDATISTLWTRSGLFFLLLQQQFCVSRYIPETVIHATKVLTLCFKLDLLNWNFWPFRRNMADSTEPSNVLFSVLEPGRILRNSINHTCIIWRWSVGICDVWLHSLLPAPWTTIHRPSKTSQGEDLMPLIKKSWISQLLHGNVHKVLIPWNFAWYAEVSPQPSLQNPRHGLRHYLIALGRCLWDIASIHDTWEEELTHIAQFLAWAILGDL